RRGREARAHDRCGGGDQAAAEGERGAAEGERDPQGCERVFRQGTRPPHDEMIRFIDEYRDRFGVELICRVLRPAVQGFLTSRGYRAAVGRSPSAHRLRDDLLVPEIARLHAENYGVYGRRKMHALMRRQGWDIGRDQTERLMRLAGVRGVKK